MMTDSRSQKLKTVNVKRPHGIAEWIKRARNVKYIPNISNGSRYGEDWLAWWHAIQPNTRHIGDTDALSKGDLSKVVVYGPNGLLSVIKALSWWRGSIKQVSDISKWHDAVSDVSFIVKAAVVS